MNCKNCGKKMVLQTPPSKDVKFQLECRACGYTEQVKYSAEQLARKAEEAR